ncbi:MAG: GTPase ObgE [Ruminococcus sp.]|jgi:GTP-binding protein|nr:GTPase ObgE [Ruminococcus sp.]
MFIDKAKIHIKAGDGGDGAVSFHREKYVAAGGPDGGDGGKGGDVVFVTDTGMSSLIDFKYKRKYIADKGDNGSGKNCTGKNAADLIVKVPKGTVIREAQTGAVMADLSVTEKAIIAKGGKGGKGNQNFATSTRQIPRFAKPGFKGDEFDIVLELKLLADVGLVGFPSVGKSSLIAAVSAARPKIADYHFTTLSPVLGVVSIGEEQSFVMADIPGLIEGASDGIGLGHEFLRHIERCRLILHILDVSEIEGRSAKDDFNVINRELERYNADLAALPQITALNKSDIASPEQISELKSYIEDLGYKCFVVSAAARTGTKELVNYIAEKLSQLPPIKEFEVNYVKPETPDNRDFTVSIEDGVFVVRAPWLVPVMRMINPDDYSSLSYFENLLKGSGIDAKLLEMGVQEGDSVCVEDFEFEYVV